MSGRDIGACSQLELRQTSPSSPFTQEFANWIHHEVELTVSDSQMGRRSFIAGPAVDDELVCRSIMRRTRGVGTAVQRAQALWNRPHRPASGGCCGGCSRATSASCSARSRSRIGEIAQQPPVARAVAPADAATLGHRREELDNVRLADEVLDRDHDRARARFNRHGRVRALPWRSGSRLRSSACERQPAAEHAQAQQRRRAEISNATVTPRVRAATPHSQLPAAMPPNAAI